MAKGFVALVGAGPGEVGLLTFRAKEYIEKADVIVYDRLVSPDILDLMPKGIRKIDVGKDPGNHKVSQEEIKYFAKRSKEGQYGSKAKRGDPFCLEEAGKSWNCF